MSSVRDYLKLVELSSKTSDGTELNSLLGSYSDDQNLAYFGQYVVNNQQELPAYYTYSPIWKKYGAEFLAVLEEREIVPKRRAVEKIGRNLATIAERLVELLKDIRDDLSIKHDVPYVTAEAVYQ
jgi:hypothetical protein